MQGQMDVLEVDDIGVFEVLANPVRLRILRHFAQPGTVKQLAEWMEVPQTRLYYHVNLLHHAGIIKVVDSRKVGAVVERIYQATASTPRHQGFPLHVGCPGTDDFEYEPDWSVVDTVSVELIDALADCDASLTVDLPLCWELATELALALPEERGTIDEYAESSEFSDPLNRAITVPTERVFKPFSRSVVGSTGKRGFRAHS